MFKNKKICLIIPCYKVKSQILLVLKSIPNFIDLIIVVDDFCPDNTYDFIKYNFNSDKLVIKKNERNLGVGGAVIEGIKIGLLSNCDIYIKVDGDNQMDLGLLEKFLYPIINDDFDYVKGNRLHSLNSIITMPKIRLFGNFILSILSKISTGNLQISDPTNGYIAIRKSALRIINLELIDNGYFFESDLLFNVCYNDLKIYEVNIDSIYRDETSNLNIIKIIPLFMYKHFRNFIKRLIK